jgi:hypothetical protein
MFTNKQLRTVIRIESETNNNNERRSDDDDEASVAHSVHCRDSVALTACCTYRLFLDYIYETNGPLS